MNEGNRQGERAETQGKVEKKIHSRAEWTAVKKGKQGSILGEGDNLDRPRNELKE